MPTRRLLGKASAPTLVGDLGKVPAERALRLPEEAGPSLRAEAVDTIVLRSDLHRVAMPEVVQELDDIFPGEVLEVVVVDLREGQRLG